MSATHPMSRTQVLKKFALLFAGCSFFYLQLCACAPEARITSGTPGMENVRLQPSTGPKARIAVATFEDKTAKGYFRIGEGMATMFTTALVNSDRFIVLERDLIDEIIGEQDLAAWGRVKAGTGAPIGEIEGAELMLTGAVTEFEPGTFGLGGGIIGLGTLITSAIIHEKNPHVPIAAATYMESHIALDVRLIDTATSRILASLTVEGSGQDWGGGIMAELGGGRSRLPIAFGTFQNAATEKAIREAIDLAVAAITLKAPKKLFNYTDEDFADGRMLGFSFLDLPGLSGVNFRSRDLRTANSTQEWTALITALGLPGTKAAPPVDFASRQVIAVFAGTQKEPGKNISIEKAVAYSDRVEITATLTAPPMSAEISKGNSEKSDSVVDERSFNPVALFHMEKTGRPVKVVWLSSGEI
jgi:curli biogenesis system outer membrane secretion channel CsgG